MTLTAACVVRPRRSRATKAVLIAGGGIWAGLSGNGGSVVEPLKSPTPARGTAIDVPPA